MEINLRSRGMLFVRGLHNRNHRLLLLRRRTIRMYGGKTSNFSVVFRMRYIISRQLIYSTLYANWNPPNYMQYLINNSPLNTLVLQLFSTPVSSFPFSSVFLLSSFIFFSGFVTCAGRSLIEGEVVLDSVCNTGQLLIRHLLNILQGKCLFLLLLSTSPSPLLPIPQVLKL